jgi:DNA repair exonuclease SbcCD ATPase subunit
LEELQVKTLLEKAFAEVSKNNELLVQQQNHLRDDKTNYQADLDTITTDIEDLKNSLPTLLKEQLDNIILPIVESLKGQNVRESNQDQENNDNLQAQLTENQNKIQELNAKIDQIEREKKEIEESKNRELEEIKRQLDLEKKETEKYKAVQKTAERALESKAEKRELSTTEVRDSSRTSREKELRHQVDQSNDIHPELNKLIEKYNSDIQQFSQTQDKVTDVSCTNFDRQNRDAPILQEKSDNSLFVVVSLQGSHYLFPKLLNISEHYYPVTQRLFNCEQYDQDSRTRFTLKKPAKVSLIPGKSNEWTLNNNRDRGELEFYS